MTGLDPPLALYFPRLCWRTLLRLLAIAPPRSTGCEESPREVFFSTNSILLWYVMMCFAPAMSSCQIDGII
ncbi:hypothetical protein C8T65DRAFT_649420 [Cerioporus squamosus]|nr:hypothetical protein C8T65DRAFT_649420 [Cerioporus squamosus]